MYVCMYVYVYVYIYIYKIICYTYIYIYIGIYRYLDPAHRTTPPDPCRTRRPAGSEAWYVCGRFQHRDLELEGFDPRLTHVYGRYATIKQSGMLQSIRLGHGMNGCLRLECEASSRQDLHQIFGASKDTARKIPSRGPNSKKHKHNYY